MRNWAIGLACLLVSSMAPLYGQSASTGILEGRVTDGTSAPVAQADILVIHQDGVTRRAVSSDAHGAFRIGFLPPGWYRLTIRRIGFQPIQINELAVRPGRVEQIAVTLERAAVRLDSVIVQAAPVRINTSDTESGSRLTTRDLALLPIPNDVHNLVAFTPGARPDQIWGAANAQANNYQLDGVSINHPGIGGDLLQPAPSWIQEIEVRGLGAGAEYGSFQGGLVNIVTRSGTDRHEGELRTNGETWRLNGTNLRVSEAGSEPSHRAELAAQLRGPVRRDRMHYALFGQLVDRETRVLNRVRQIAGDLAPEGPADRELKLLGKLDWQPGRPGKDIVIGSVGFTRLSAERFGLTGFQSSEAGQRLRSSILYSQLSWQRSWSSRNFVEVKLAGFTGTDRRDSYNGTDVPGVATLLEVNPREFQNAPFRERRDPGNLGLTINWDLYARTFGAEHHLKIGGEYAFGSWREQIFRNGGMTWRPYERVTPPAFDPAVPPTWASGPIVSSWGGEVALDSRVQNGALYLQDYFRITRRVSINPGLRFGSWVGQLQRADGSGYFTPVSTTGWDPRIGIMVDLDGRSTLVAKAHWGIFHQSLFAGFFDRAAGADVYSDEERWAYSGPGFTDPRTTFREEDRTGTSWQKLQTVRLNETGPVENFKEPYVEQATLGLEKTFGDHLKLDALFVRRRNKDMVALVDRNLAANYTTYQNVTVLDRFFRPIQFQGQPLVLSTLAVSNEDILYWRAILQSGESTNYADYYPPGMPRDQWAALTYQPDLVLTTVPEATRKFDQLQLTATARYATWWAQGSATLTRLRGNLNSVTGNDDYTTSGAGPFVRLNEQTNFYGDLNNQSRFEFKLQAGARLPAGFRGGAFLTHVEGDWVTPTLTISDLALEFQLPDTSSTGAPPVKLRSYLFHFTNGQRIFVQPRGSYRYPSRTSLDLHLEHGFRLRRTELVVSLDAFNALGASTVTEVQTSVNGSLDLDFPSQYGETRLRVPPRTIRIGVNVGW